MRTAVLRFGTGSCCPTPSRTSSPSRCWSATTPADRSVGAFVGGLGIRGGAVACSVNHDSHNIFVVGDDHESMAVAANAVADAGGGYAAVVGTEVRALVRACPSPGC